MSYSASETDADGNQYIIQEEVLEDLESSSNHDEQDDLESSSVHDDEMLSVSLRGDDLDDLEAALIDCIRSYKSLYDRTSPHYKNNALKAQIWERIAHSLNKDIETLKRIWDNLRNRFVKERGKIEKEFSGSERDYGSSEWRYFNKMLFLKDHIARRQKKSRKRLSISNSIRMHSNYTQPIAPKTVVSSLDSLHEIEILPGTSENDATVGDDCEIQASTRSTHQKGDVLKSIIDGYFAIVNTKLNESANDALSKMFVNCEKEDASFLQFIADELNTLEPSIKKAKKKQIVQILYE